MIFGINLFFLLVKTISQSEQTIFLLKQSQTRSQNVINFLFRINLPYRLKQINSLKNRWFMVKSADYPKDLRQK